MSESLVNYKEPRYTYIFSEDIDPEPTQKLIDVLHSHEKIDLFFCTDGGLILAMDALIHYMNQHPDLDIYLSYQVCSCGTDILHKFKGNIFITKQLDFFLFHAIDRKTYQVRDQGYDRNVMNKITKQMNKDYEKVFKSLGANEEEMKMLRDGKDIYWYRKDFKRLTDRFDNIKVL